MFWVLQNSGNLHISVQCNCLRRHFEISAKAETRLQSHTLEASPGLALNNPFQNSMTFNRFPDPFGKPILAIFICRQFENFVQIFVFSNLIFKEKSQSINIRKGMFRNLLTTNFWGKFWNSLTFSIFSKFPWQWLKWNFPTFPWPGKCFI